MLAILRSKQLELSAIKVIKNLFKNLAAWFLHYLSDR